MPNSNPACQPPNYTPESCSDLEMDHLGSIYPNLCLSGDGIFEVTGIHGPLTLSYLPSTKYWNWWSDDLKYFYYVTCLTGEYTIWELYWGNGSRTSLDTTFPNLTFQHSDYSTTGGTC